ncbi:MAG TPA: hypothetical protein VFS43_09215, partial [Polyangiaceae bacterium]|nr:hypothetical protein [Polyangiaceae bacterium]
MKTLKTRLLSVVGAAALAISVPLTAVASWSTPNSGDVTYAVGNILVEASKILALVNIDVSKVKVVEIEDVLTGDELVQVKNNLNNLTTQLQLIALKNNLNNLDILNGNNILTIGDVLSNNDVDIDDVVGTQLFSDGNLLIFSCKTCKLPPPAARRPLPRGGARRRPERRHRRPAARQGAARDVAPSAGPPPRSPSLGSAGSAGAPP